MCFLDPFQGFTFPYIAMWRCFSLWLFPSFHRAAAIAERSKWRGGWWLTFSCELTLLFCLDRARVIGGLPDVVAIQEGKVLPSLSSSSPQPSSSSSCGPFFFPCLQSLNLTGNVWGDPVPEVSWTKNEKELLCDDHYKLTYEHGKFASITIAAVTEADSGKYALLVKNKYGKEAGAFTVSVYNPEEEESKEEKKGQWHATEWPGRRTAWEHFCLFFFPGCWKAV